MTRELQIAVERAAQAAQTDPLVEALEALYQLTGAVCGTTWAVRESMPVAGAVLVEAQNNALAVLAKYAPDREGGAE